MITTFVNPHPYNNGERYQSINGHGTSKYPDFHNERREEIGPKSNCR